MVLADYPAPFQYAVTQTLLAEGGALVTNHKWDPGGLTKYGITKRSYPHLDIENLTYEEALDIYYRDFWRDVGLHQVLSKFVAAEIFDTSVNTGQRRGALIAQETVNYMDSTPTLKLDGKLGPESIAAINRLAKRYELSFVLALNWWQGFFYIKVCKSNPLLAKAAAKGLMKRLIPPKELLL